MFYLIDVKNRRLITSMPKEEALRCFMSEHGLKEGEVVIAVDIKTATQLGEIRFLEGQQSGLADAQRIVKQTFKE